MMVLQICSGGSLLRSNVKPSEGEKILKKVTDAIWYLDGRKETINEASRKRKRGEFIPTPTRFDKFSNYQNWKKWKKKPKLKQPEYKLHAKALIAALESNAIRWPCDWRQDIDALSSSLSSLREGTRTGKHKAASETVVFAPGAST